MSSHYFNNLFTNFFIPSRGMDFLSCLNENESSESEFPLNDDVHIQKYEALKEINDDYYNTHMASKIFENHFDLLSNGEENKKEFNELIIGDINNSINIENIINSTPFSRNLENKEKKRYFEVVYPTKESLFTNDKNNNKKKVLFLKRKRFKFRRRRIDNTDNIRKKIKRGFFNVTLIAILNEKLKNIGSHKYFEKFPPFFVVDIDRQRNKKIFEMTLKDIFENKKLYEREKKRGLNNYLHNLKAVQSEDVKNNEEFKIILNKTITELFEEYINSDEFKIGEINRLKKKKMNDDYINRYIYLANHLIEFFSK